MKINLTAIALSGIMLVTGVVHANANANGIDFDPRFYIGGEVGTNQVNGKKEINTNIGPLEREDKKAIFQKKNLGSASLIVGSKLNDYVGVEAGITGMKKIQVKEKDTQGKATLKMRNIYADVLGYLPVAEQVDLIGSVGVGLLNSKVNGQFTDDTGRVAFSSKSSKAGARIGAGVGVKLNEDVSARLMVRHQQGNKHVKSVNSAGLGLFYNF